MQSLLKADPPPAPRHRACQKGISWLENSRNAALRAAPLRRRDRHRRIRLAFGYVWGLRTSTGRRRLLTAARAGAIVSFSVAAAPAAKAVPQTTAKVWSELYARGANVMPKVASAVALSYAYVAYHVSARGGSWQGYAGAAALVLAIVPFTLTAMRETNAALHAAADGASDDASDAAAVADLMDSWIQENLVRGIFPLSSALMGAWAYLWVAS